jgi:hypothetical protein
MNWQTSLALKNLFKACSFVVYIASFINIWVHSNFADPDLIPKIGNTLVEIFKFILENKGKSSGRFY